MGGEPYRFSRPVESAPGFVLLELPDDVLDACRPGLPDLRLVQSGDHEVEYAFERRVAVPTRIPLVDVESMARRETAAIADRGASPRPVSWLSVEMPKGVFLKPVVVEVSDDRSAWREIAQGSIFATDAVTMTTMRFAPTDRRYIRLVLDDRDSSPIQPEGIVVPSNEAPASPPREIPLSATPTPGNEPGLSTYTVTLPARNLPLSALRIGAANPVFSRRVRVYERVFFRDGISRRLLGEGAVVRSGVGDGQNRVLVGGASGRTLEIEVDDGSSAPLAISEVTALVDPKRIIFFAPPSASLVLAYGSAAATSPTYDLEAAFARGLPSKIARATLGAAKDSGAQAVAVPPPPRGAAVDRSRWRARWPVALPEGPGVAYLDLDGSLAADAPSLRIVDGGGLQVPYLIEESPHPVRRPITLDVRHRGSHTIATAVGLDPSERSDAIEVSVPAPAYFSRDVSVAVDVTDSRGVTGRRLLGSAHWERRPDQASSPFRIAIAGPTGPTVDIEIDDGDNAPLTLGTAKIELVRWRVDFVFDKGDSLWVLSGNPEAQAPSYDLALLASSVLQAPARPAKLGPASTLASAKQVGFSRWLWAGIIVAAMLIALALARTLRSA
jgi:hypothetical protein